MTCIIRIITTGTLLSATGATVGAPIGAIVGAPTLYSLILPLASLTVSDLGIHHNREKLLRMINFLTIYHKNKDNKLKIRESLVVAAIELFKSFEIKFREATFYKNHEIALIKLAHDAIDRLFNFFDETSAFLEEDFLSSSNILRASILGKSKRYKNIFSLPHRHLGYALDNAISTKRIYKDTPILKIVSENEIYCYKRNNSPDITDFRFIFAWEEDIDPSIQWGIDEITLVGNRKYTKLASISESTLDNLTLFRLNDEELDDKKQKILYELNTSSINKTEETYREEVMNGFKEEIIELKNNIMDLNSFMVVTTESLRINKIIQKDESPSQEMNVLEDKMMTIYNLIKKDVEAADNFDIYIPLHAYFNLGLPISQKPFLLFEKVISFIRSNKQKNLLILGESGFGKTSFLIYLTKFIVNNLFFSIKNSLIPFYMRVSRLKNKNLKTINTKKLLQDYYKFNHEEIEFLLNRKGVSFCFIFDNIELNLDLDILFANILKNFPSSYFIFTAYSRDVLSIIKDKPTIINIAAFNEESKIEYIKQYIKINLFSSLMSENEETIYQRIKAISNLEKLTDKPVVLKIVMEVLIPLEKFYQQKYIVTGSEYIYEDLFHIYTHVLYTQMAKKFKFTKGITHIGKQSLYECLLNYAINLATLMKKIGILEVDENLFSLTHVDVEKISSLKTSFEQLFLFKKFFTKKYNPILFKDNDEFKQYKYGYQGCLFIHTYGVPDNLSFAFNYNEFLEYFFNFNLLRREKIQLFIDSLEEKSSSLLSLQSLNKEGVTIRSRHVSEIQSHRSFKTQSSHISVSDRESVYPHLYSRSTSKQESCSPSRCSSTTSKGEGLSSRKYSVVGEAPKVSYFGGMSRTDKGKSSYLVNVAGHSSPIAEAVDTVAITDLPPLSL